jgi:site-specific DNA recombinase
MRAVLYARYSTGNQSPLSTGDQLRLCRELAKRLGAHVVREFVDPEISGFDGSRPEFNALLDFARAGRCDLVIAEHSNRLARDGEKGWATYNLFRGLGVKYWTVQEGEVTTILQGVSTLMSEAKGDEVREFTRRGLRGVVEAGRSAGGLTYGYRKVRAYDDAGEPLRGLLEVDEAQACVVRRILADYAAGVSPQAIAHALNREGVAGPRGGTWNASTIHGSAERSTGIIHNELYVGVRIWGRRTFVKDRATGSRRGRTAAGEPIRQLVPQLRLVDDDLWADVRARRAQVSTGPMGEGVRGRRRPKRFLQGLVVCSGCGRPMRMAGPGGAMRCATRIEKGLCANNRSPAYAKIEARVVEALRANLLSPAAIEVAIAEYQAVMREARRDAGKRRAKLEAELADLERRQARLIDSLEQGVPWAALKARHEALEAKKAEASAAIAQDDAEGSPVVDLPTHPAKAYRAHVEAILAALDRLDDPSEPAPAADRAALRGLVEQVRFTPAEGHGRFDLELHGDLAPLLQLGQNEESPLAGAFDAAQLKRELGAGTRFTRRLRVRAPVIIAA